MRHRRGGASKGQEASAEGGDGQHNHLLLATAMGRTEKH